MPMTSLSMKTAGQECSCLLLAGLYPCPAPLQDVMAPWWWRGDQFSPAACRCSSLEEGPAVAGEPVYAETGRVAEGPPVPAAAARHAHMGSPAEPPGLRVVTYNILADQYATSEHALTHLFAYCPPQCAPSHPASCHCRAPFWAPCTEHSAC